MIEGLELVCSRLRKVVENVVVLDAVDSTHAMALRLIGQMDEEGLDLPPTVLVAGDQGQGHGRGDRTWQSPVGGLYLSWLRSGLDRAQIQVLPMVAAAAVHQALAAAGLDRVAVKWPNDILVDGAKIAGILIHARHGEPTWVTVGIGVNLISRPVVREAGALPATSFADHLPIADAAELTAALAADIVMALTRGVDEPDELLARWRRALVHRPGDRLAVRLADGAVVEGRFVGLTDSGYLELATASGPRIVSGGDVIEQS